MNDQDSLKWRCGEVQLVACVVLLLLMLGSDNGSSWVRFDEEYEPACSRQKF
jgi:hypothetical protein